MSEKQTVLIVDDVELNRAFLSDILSESYEVLEACDGLGAIAQIKKHGTGIGIVLLDVIMPGMDGFEVLARMKKYGWIKSIPVVLISAESSSEYIARGYELGATDYISRPFDARIIKRRISNTLMLYTRQKKLERLVVTRIKESDRINSLLIDCLGTIAEFYSGESGAHIKEVQIVTRILLEAVKQRFPKYGLTYADIDRITLAASFHDIGKFEVPDCILKKPARLTADEFEQVKIHAQAGARMLERVCLGQHEEFVKLVQDICLCHHERWDGRGYPRGLKETEISIAAQAVSIAEVYDSLINKQVYREAYSHKDAVGMILRGECGRFNPDMLECFMAELNVLGEAFSKTNEKEKLEVAAHDLLDMTGVEKNSAVSERTLFLLEQERIKYQFMAALSNEVLFEYDLVEDKMTFSERAQEELGIPLVISKIRKNRQNLKFLERSEILEIVRKLGETTPEEPFIRSQYQVKLPDKTMRWYEFTMRSMWGEGFNPAFLGFIGKLTNIHASKLENVRLKTLAEHDPLTGLYNQATVRGRVDEALLNNADGMAVLLFFDFDNFKTVNDTRGHAFGDRILCHIADTVKNNIRQADIAARVGGDEFVVFAKNMPGEGEAVKFAAKLFDALCGTYEKYDFSVSMGAAVSPADGNTYQMLFEAADEALYASKGSGKKQYTFYRRDDSGISRL